MFYSRDEPRMPRLVLFFKPRTVLADKTHYPAPEAA